MLSVFLLYAKLNKKISAFTEILLDEIGIKMADYTEWDPNVVTRVTDQWNRLKTVLSPESVKTFLFPNKDD